MRYPHNNSDSVEILLTFMGVVCNLLSYHLDVMIQLEDIHSFLSELMGCFLFEMSESVFNC